MSDSAGKDDCRVSVRQKDKAAFVSQLLPIATQPKGVTHVPLEREKTLKGGGKCCPP